MDSHHSEFVVSPPPSSDPTPKSPALAFEPTSNDSLAPRIPSPSKQTEKSSQSLGPQSITGIMSPRGEQDLQVIVDQQASAMDRLHEAFAAERQVWNLEKDWLHQRIASLEQLLKTRDHHSPAKSPVMSPLSTVFNGNGIISSPQSRAMSGTPHLPSIAEDDGIQPMPLSRRRDGAPVSIDFSRRPPVPAVTLARSSRSQRQSSVSFDQEIRVDEVPISPPTSAMPMSPLSPANRAEAGHTPLKAADRPSTPPPGKMTFDGIEDTPTRNNTHINLMLTRSNEDEDDVLLKGPLCMPELPNQPDASNFTLEALSKRLEQVARSPEESRPTIYNEPSPGMLSPKEPAPLDSAVSDHPHSASQHSPAISPGSLAPAAEAPQELYNGVKLKKKPSVNFGAPFGQLGGFGGRKLS
ncbi:hypothetical protein LTR78_003952 [Recurvomyces mirabilis]|uniref:Uncharacterized protein n=1 Tax=Recurvomyces mirabilis TaxID=574656 RepID=A0AAE0WQM2_9PEZI|nr:hypothetical protein LTR78_003952 [Recurvomyces mirabilis]KAK5153910.1 hypothetical protein LTS14_007130 [Recurvomyces mirabilis]